MKIAFLLLLILHAAIHLFGFVKAFDIAAMPQLSKDISKTQGIFWLMAALLFIAAAVMFWMQKEPAWIVCIAAIIISQMLIFYNWHDARFATIPNAIALVVSVLWFGFIHFQNGYRADVSRHLQQTKEQAETFVTENDLLPLPLPVQKYLRYSGAINKPVVKNFKVDFIGQMRAKDKGFFPLVSEQYNFIDEPARLFFMKAKMLGITVPGYHNRYRRLDRMNS